MNGPRRVRTVPAAAVATLPARPREIGRENVVGGDRTNETTRVACRQLVHACQSQRFAALPPIQLESESYFLLREHFEAAADLK